MLVSGMGFFTDAADLLVLGARGREGFIGLLLGSVGEECAVHAPCPVLIVKPTTNDGSSS